MEEGGSRRDAGDGGYRVTLSQNGPIDPWEAFIQRDLIESLQKQRSEMLSLRRISHTSPYGICSRDTIRPWHAEQDVSSADLLKRSAPVLLSPSRHFSQSGRMLCRMAPPVCAAGSAAFPRIILFFLSETAESLSRLSGFVSLTAQAL